MRELFENYKTMIIFFHIISAVIWVGGMIAIKVAVHPAIMSIDEAKIRLGKNLQIVGRLFNLVMPFIAISALCGVIIIKGAGYTGMMIHLKETIWTIMTLNYAYMYTQRAKAQRLYTSGDMAQAKNTIRLLPTVLLPINIVLGVIAIFLGVMLRG
ncbi:MAG: hypothetical protein PHN18_00600 [Sulfurospirillaceae bacterium]|nr:hypothetical protein [Sulfurospirillaceae bacterium]MDD2826162.1 hypothetical protein [Sulfurospirillaceae bacterium]